MRYSSITETPCNDEIALQLTKLCADVECAIHKAKGSPSIGNIRRNVWETYDYMLKNLDKRTEETNEETNNDL